MGEDDVDHLLARTAELRQHPVSALEGYKGMMVGYINGQAAATLAQWTARQTYITLGNFMTSAALLGIDTCAMEGLDPAQYDRILGLEGSGYHTVVACPAGYRAGDDEYASKAKVRFPLEEMLIRR